jgi:methyl acetate hydrolase
MPNLVIAVADRSAVRYTGAAGSRVIGGSGDGQVGPESLFRLGSMTKQLVIVAALQLVEVGRLDFEAPVAHYLPEFARLPVLESFHGDVPRIRPPNAPVTIRHLATHTSGLSYDYFSANQRRWQELTGTPNSWSGEIDAFAAPLHFDPGTRWQYGLSIDWLGRVLEEVTGQGLDLVLEAGVTGPLDMADTTFTPSDVQRASCVPVHFPVAPGEWEASPLELPEQPDWWSGGHGLYSTPRDYLRFCRMLLGGGSLEGVTVLGPGAVSEMFRDQIAPLEIPANLPTNDPAMAGDREPRPGFGYCLLVTKDDLPGMRAAGSGSFGGMYNTNFVVDPARGWTWVVFSQVLPGAMPQTLELNTQVELAVYT